jgi:mono/diheme cytochrome c family protein
MKTARTLIALGVLVLGFYLVFTRVLGIQESEGKIIYDELCAGCHGSQGEGFADLHPPLAGSDYLSGLSDETLVCMVKNGKKGGVTVNGKVYNVVEMPGFPKLSPTQVANLVNYIRKQWAPGPNLSPKQAETLWQGCSN